MTWPYICTCNVVSHVIVMYYIRITYKADIVIQCSDFGVPCMYIYPRMACLEVSTNN